MCNGIVQQLSDNLRTIALRHLGEQRIRICEKSVLLVTHLAKHLVHLQYKWGLEVLI